MWLQDNAAGSPARPLGFWHMCSTSFCVHPPCAATTGAAAEAAGQGWRVHGGTGRGFHQGSKRQQTAGEPPQGTAGLPQGEYRGNRVPADAEHIVHAFSNPITQPVFRCHAACNLPCMWWVAEQHRLSGPSNSRLPAMLFSVNCLCSLCTSARHVEHFYGALLLLLLLRLSTCRWSET